MRDVEQVVAGLKAETVREITKENVRPEAQLAWYWTYIGSLDMAQRLGLINLLAAVNSGNRKTWHILLPTFQFGSNIKQIPPLHKQSFAEQRLDFGFFENSING